MLVYEARARVRHGTRIGKKEGRFKQLFVASLVLRLVYEVVRVRVCVEY